MLRAGRQRRLRTLDWRRGRRTLDSRVPPEPWESQQEINRFCTHLVILSEVVGSRSEATTQSKDPLQLNITSGPTRSFCLSFGLQGGPSSVLEGWDSTVVSCLGFLR